MPSTACLFGSLLTYFLASPVAYAGTAPITSAHATYNTLASLTTHAHCVEPAATKITTRLITPIIGTAGSTRALYPPLHSGLHHHPACHHMLPHQVPTQGAPTKPQPFTHLGW